MTDFRQDFGASITDRQRHISQKLAQIREYRALVEKWRSIMKQLSEWFEGLEGAASEARWFSVESMIRMLNIMGQLQQLMAEFQQVGDPKVTGTTVAAGDSSSEVARVTEWITSRAGPLADTAPWDLRWSLDPELQGSLAQGDIAVYYITGVLNPISTLTFGWHHDTVDDLTEEMLEEHAEDIEALHENWHEAKRALDDMNRAFERLDQETLGGLEQQLEGVLEDYESIYDSAAGASGPSAAGARQAASGR